MNKQELIRKISEDTNLTQKQASAALDSMLDAIMDAVKNHEKVQLVGFGTFEAKQRNKRTGRNPSIGRACIQSRQGFQGCGKIIVRHRLQTGYAVWR